MGTRLGCRNLNWSSHPNCRRRNHASDPGQPGPARLALTHPGRWPALERPWLLLTPPNLSSRPPGAHQVTPTYRSSSYLRNAVRPCRLQCFTVIQKQYLINSSYPWLGDSYPNLNPICDQLKGTQHHRSCPMLGNIDSQINNCASKIVNGHWGREWIHALAATEANHACRITTWIGKQPGHRVMPFCSICT